ncbi:tyrosine-type recombinase/integrase [Novosphingobium sp. YJ-S2-02]|uniref:Tyrosine-type recombinase/integrase n=1 Tax=Novosphingobium aureum TaxID=2792964 RepID=A0A931MMA3_9SPHN|nr:tyrosine-type recombinase/integrase [Novosphingobium aureum]MBH0114205.1 tyrosine-type recombinase/integrase [Novosphingobium aureum]
MTRQRLRSNRFLPEYVSRFKDRHGKERLRFRRKGYPSQYFTAALGTEAFREEYRRFNSAEAVAQAREDAHAANTIPGSIGDLLRRYLAIPERLGPSATTQTKVRQILERFAQGREDRPVKAIRFEHIDAIIAKARIKTVDANGRKVGGIEAARKLRKELRRFFAFARKLGWLTTNPVDDTQQVRVAPGDQSTGFYTWSEDDIAIYRNRWALGTKQRLAMELMLWTDQRKVDAIHLGRQHVSGGKFVIRQSKTGKLLRLPIAPQLAAAIDAMPPSDAMCFLVTEWGKPFSVKGFGGWFREQCDAAGLPKCTAHGLRKATMRRMAELEMPNKTMKSVSGHSKDDEVARYTAAANQERLAEGAISRLAEWEMSNLDPRLDTNSAEGAENGR